MEHVDWIFFNEVPIGAAFRLYRGKQLLRKMNDRSVAIVGGTVALETVFDGLERCCVVHERSWSEGQLRDHYYDRAHVTQPADSQQKEEDV